MSGLFGSLANNVKALTAQSRAVEAAGRNLANVNNPTYSRQRVLLGDRGTVHTPLGAQSLGIEAKQIQQLRDTLLDQQVVRETSRQASLQAEQAAYEKAQAGLGQSIDRSQDTPTLDSTSAGHALGESLTALFTAFQAVASSPTDIGERQSLLQDAAILVDRLKATDGRFEQLQADLTTQAGSDVGEANTLLSTIANLNGQIGRLEVNAPGSAVDLRDQRQARLEELATKMSFETRPAAGHPGQIELFARGSGGGEVPLINLANVTGPVALSGGTLTAGTPSTTLALGGGSLQGLLGARDGPVQTLRDQLDTLVNQLVTSVNSAYNPSGTTGNFFDAAGLSAGTIAIQSGLSVTTLKASDGGAAGDNTLALAVANLADKPFATANGDLIDGTLSGYYNRTVMGVGQAVKGATDRLQDQDNVSTLVRSQRDAVSGVSLDEEMADLLKYQRSFQASSRVIQVIDELLDVVVNRLSR